MAKGEILARKAEYFAKLYRLLETYSKIFIVEADNVGSDQMHKIRISLRGKAVILMGKNTMMRRAIRAKVNENPALEKLLPHIVGNIGFVFTNDNLRGVRENLLAIRMEAPAKAGAIAPGDVYVDAQNTGMGPEKTSFFQALGIATKITKGTIEILSKVHLIKKGDKVGPSEATLLNMLKISPFTYGLNVKTIYEEGMVYKNEVLDLTDEELLNGLVKAIHNIAGVSLALSLPTIAAVPHLLLNSFKDTLAISVETDYTFSYSEQIKEYLEDPSKFASLAAPASQGADVSGGDAPAPAQKEEEKKEESDEDMGFGLFD